MHLFKHEKQKAPPLAMMLCLNVEFPQEVVVLAVNMLGSHSKVNMQASLSIDTWQPGNMES